MNMPRTLLLSLLASSLPLTAQDLEADHVAVGNWFEVHAHVPGPKGEKLAEEVLGIAEDVWKLGGKMYKLPRKRLSNRFEIHLYRLVPDYERVDQVQNRGAFRERGRFTNFDTKQTHILLTPVEDELFEKTGLIAPDRLAVLQETTDIAIKSAFDNFRAHPAWFFQGLKARLRDAINEERDFVTDRTRDPRESTQLSYVIQVLDEGKVPTVESMIAGNDLSGIGNWAWEAMRESLYRFLWETQERTMKRYESTVMKYPGSNSLPEKMETLARKMLRREWDDLDGEFKKWLGSIEPQWEENYRAAWQVEDGIKQVAATQNDARIWRFRKPKSGTYTISGTFELEQTKNPGVAFLLDRQLDRDPETGYEKFIYIGAQAGGTVFAQSFDSTKSEGAQWGDLGQSSQGFPVGKPVEFELVVGEGIATVRFDGEDALVLSTEGHDMTGQWGFGLRDGSSAVWRDVRISDAP